MARPDRGVGGRLIVVVTRDAAALPCRVIALHTLRSAQELHKERIRVDKPGHACEFPVVELAAWFRPRAPFAGSLVRAGSVAAHGAFGNTFEERRPVWPVGTVVNDPTRVSLQRGG